MNLAKAKRNLIKAVRLYPLLALSVLALAYFLGAFEEREDPIIAQESLITWLYLFVGVVPLFFIIAFALVGNVTDREFKKMGSKSDKFSFQDPFLLPNEVMHGYKLALITNRPATLTGLSGDSYKADDQAVCGINSEHVPPVLDCECGFYAYKDFEDAKFELSLNPGSFLIDVELFGLGYVYKRGYRAESQVVSKLRVPKRCMRCHLLPARVFVAIYKLGYSASSWWQWQIRCTLCARGVKQSDQLTIFEMNSALAISK